MKSKFIKFPLVLGVIVFLATAGVGKVYLMTRDSIRQQKSKKIKEALHQVLCNAQSFEIAKTEASVDSYWVAKDSFGNIMGFAFLGSSRGYSSNLVCMTGIDTAGFIKGICILSEQETPGLGARVEEVASNATIWNPDKKSAGSGPPWFQEQFTGLDAKKAIRAKRGAEWHTMNRDQQDNLRAENSISVLSGATISSESILRAMEEKAGKIIESYRKMPTVVPVDTVLSRK